MTHITKATKTSVFHRSKPIESVVPVQLSAAVSMGGEHRAAVGGLPSLNRNNSNENLDSLPSHNRLTTAHKKSAAALAWNVQALADKYGIEKLGFLTFTFAQHILCSKESQRRLNSLATGVLRERYQTYVRIFERQKSGRIHYHLLVVLKDDIRTGSNFDEFKAGVYSSANKALRSEWKFWRETSKLYGFGRTELLPVRSTAEGIAKYVGKYIGKSIEKREERDKGVRLVEYGASARMATTKFAFASAGSASWRRKVATFARIVAETHDLPCFDLSHLSQILGPKWAYTNREFILSLPDSLPLPEKVEPETEKQKGGDPACGEVSFCADDDQTNRQTVSEKTIRYIKTRVLMLQYRHIDRRCT
jgi:hypothetical protein